MKDVDISRDIRNYLQDKPLPNLFFLGSSEFNKIASNIIHEKNAIQPVDIDECLEQAWVKTLNDELCFCVAEAEYNEPYYNSGYASYEERTEFYESILDLPYLSQGVRNYFTKELAINNENYELFIKKQEKIAKRREEEEQEKQLIANNRKLIDEKLMEYNTKYSLPKCYIDTFPFDCHISEGCPELKLQDDDYWFEQWRLWIITNESIKSEIIANKYKFKAVRNICHYLLNRLSIKNLRSMEWFSSDVEILCQKHFINPFTTN